MAPSFSDRSAPARTFPEWLASPWFFLFLSLAIGFVVGQAVTGHLAPRWIKAILGFVFMVALLRLPLYGVVCLFLIAFPFPTRIFLGNTNIIFVLFMLVVWGIKVRLGKEPAPPRTYLDYAAWFYIAVHLLSLVNVETSEDLSKGISQIEFLAAAVGLYALVSKVLRTERHLRIAFYSLAATSLLVSITGVMEYFLPTIRLIPDWFIAAGPGGRRFAEGGRVGGVFRFHGLLADFCAMMFIVQAYLFIRARSLWIRCVMSALMAAGVFQIFATANRGGFIIWVIGFLYFVWLGRSALTVRRVVVGLPVVFIAAFLIDVATAEYGKVLTLWVRLVTTQFKSGIPDTRVEVWREILKEIPNHIWIGHGPFFNLLGGKHALGRQWPHSAFLMYLWTTGIVGLTVFMWILLKSIVRSFPGPKLHLGEVPFSRGALAVTHVLILQFALAQIRDEHQRGNVYVFMMWAFFGLAVAARRIWLGSRGERSDVTAERSQVRRWVPRPSGSRFRSSRKGG